MRYKFLIILLLIISIVFLLYIVENSYSQPPSVAEVIQPDEIAKILEDVKQKPTTGETFDRRIKVVEAWIVLSIMAGDREELRQAAPPGVIQNIARLKTEGKENEALKMLDELFLKMEKIGLPKRLEAAPSQQGAGQGRCGDGTCDDFEKSNPNLCPQDCEAQKKASQPMTSALKPAKPITAKITIDYSNALGAFSPYIFGIGTIKDEKGFELAQKAGFKLIEVGAVPMHSGKGSSDLPKYDFSEMDREISSIFKAGAEPLVVFLQDVQKPSDMNAFAAYVKAVAVHLKNIVWTGNGKIKALRFGNEPDNRDFWKGTKQDFFETYAAFARAIKSVDPSFIIAAPALMIGIDLDGSLGPWVDDFLSYMDKNRVPLDLFSTHLYSPVPYSYYRNFGMLKDAVNKYPNLSPIYGAPKLANDEWTIFLGDIWSGSYHKQFDTAFTASHNIISLINMIEQDVVLSRPMTATNTGKFGCHDFLLVDCKGEGKSSYYALKGFNWLANTNRLSVEGNDHMNLAAIAGKGKNEIIIAISSYDVQTYMDKYEPSGSPLYKEYSQYVSKVGTPKVYDKFDLLLKNLPWALPQKVVYERYLVDDRSKLELIETKTAAGDKTLAFSGDMTVPSVQVIKVYLK